MNLGLKIVKIRKEHKMSQEDFAELFNVTRQTISSWENSKSYPDIETLIKISNKFNISLDILLKEDERMIKQIDEKMKENKKLKLFTWILIILVIGITTCLCVNNYIQKEQEKKDNIRYKEIMNNIKILGFSDNDGIGFSSIYEDGVTYKVYVKKPEALDPTISANTKWTEDEAIIVDYNGKRAAVTYINENKTTVYCDKSGKLLNDKQNTKNTEIYKKYQERTINIITRMVELFEEIYN